MKFENEPTKSPGKLCLWYTRPGKTWTEALPVGNGYMGAMVSGGVNTEHIQFNECTVWTGEPHDYAHKGAVKYLPEIRRLLFAGKQGEAEALAEREFMSEPCTRRRINRWAICGLSFRRWIRHPVIMLAISRWGDCTQQL